MKFKLQSDKNLNQGSDYYKGYEIKFNPEDEYYIRNDSRGVIQKGFSTDKDAEEYVENNLISENSKELQETMNSDVKGEVFNSLSNIAYSNDVEMNDMIAALKWFIRKFYIEADDEID